MSELTLVERLDRIIDGYYLESEDYRVVRQALKQVDYMNRPKVASDEWENEGGMCGTDLGDESMA